MSHPLGPPRKHVTVTFTVKEHPVKDQHSHNKGTSGRKSRTWGKGTSQPQHTDESKSAGHKARKCFLDQQARERRDERGEGDAGGGGGVEAQNSKRTPPDDGKRPSERTPRSTESKGIAGKSTAHPIPSGNPTPPTVTGDLLKAQPNCREEIQRARGTTLISAIDRRRRRRPQSAGVTMTTSASPARRASVDGRRKLVSPVTPSVPGEVIKDPRDNVDARVSEVHGIAANRETRGKVVPACWRASVSPGRRPLPLGKTNVPPNTTKKKPEPRAASNRRKKEDGGEEEEGGSWYGAWNNSSSCDDLALGLIDKDMERAMRKFHQVIDETPAAGDAAPTRAVYSRQGKRPSSRPTTGTNAKILFTPDPAGSETRAPPSCHDRSPSGMHHHHGQAKAATNYTPTANNPRRRAATTGSHAGRRREWNESTLVDVLHTPDALLRKHPGWDVAAGARGPQPDGRLGHRGAFIFGGSSTARTITTRETSSGSSSVVGGRRP